MRQAVVRWPSGKQEKGYVHGSPSGGTYFRTLTMSGIQRSARIRPEQIVHYGWTEPDQEGN